MTKGNSTTKTLAELVFKKIKGAKVSQPLPNEDVLNILFENLFYASIQTEEGDFIKVTVTLINSKNPDPVLPGRIVKDRWNFIYFDNTVPFNVKNIVKLSKAADPWSSSLAVDFNDANELFIWGMIDQAVHYQSFLHYEVESGPEQPGIFQTSITDIGNLVVIFDYELIATLKQNVLVSNYLDVFKRGNICALIKNNITDLKAKLRTFLENKFPDEGFDIWEHYCEGIWTQALCRILIRIQGYEHGGAFLLTNNFEKDFDIKYKLKYDRLSNSIYNFVEVAIENSLYSETIHNVYTTEDKDIPLDLYLDEALTSNTKQETNDELKGAIRYVASLSSIDGLVLMNHELKVKGFGVVIKNIMPPEKVYIPRSSHVTATNLTEVPTDNFGTRHRSMFSYCWKYEGSLGFVVSQDGDIRAITKIGDKLIMWENIKVQQLFKSKKLKRSLIKKLVK